MFTGPFVQRLGRHVEAIGPNEGANLRVDVDLGEAGGVRKRLEHAAPVVVGEVDVADEPVAEGEA